jgi:hypothetical protein
MHLFIIIAALTSVFRLNPGFEASAKAQVEAPQLLQAKCQLHNSFVDCEGRTWFNPTGTLHLFEVVGDSAARRIDKSIHHGTTYESLLFCHDDKIFMFGGYGMFIFQTALIYFDKNNREWFDQKIEGLPNNRVKSYATQFGDSLIVFTKPNIDASFIELGVVNLNTFTYQKVSEFDGAGFFTEKFTLHGKQIDYLESVNNESTSPLIFDKADLRFYEINFAFLVPSKDYGTSGIRDQEVFAESLDASNNRILKKFSFAGYKSKFPEYHFNSKRNYTWWWALLAIATVSVVFSVVIYRKKRLLFSLKQPNYQAMKRNYQG